MTQGRPGLSELGSQRRHDQQARHGGGVPGRRGNKWWTLAAVCLGTFMLLLLLDITIVNVALPDIQRALNSSFSDLQWVVDAYALTLAAFLLTAGSLADMYGRRLIYVIGLVAFTCASVLFSGGSVAVFGLSASIFAMLLYLVLYLQDILGYSPLATGVRLMVISGGILATSTVAGRLTARVPIRLLIGPGLIVVGVGAAAHARARRELVLCPSHPGHDRGRAGIGMVNPPLASTAVGVVPPAGRHGLGHQLHLPPGRDRHRHRPARDAVLQPGEQPGTSAGGSSTGADPPRPADRRRGAVRRCRAVIGKLPEHARQAVGTITRTAFTTGLNRILLIAAIIALVSGVVSLAAIRSKDFAHQREPGSAR